jgi:pimeloyl-ACP methyl ester carboxylesterase
MPDRPSLVLLPGLLCDAALWAPQRVALSDLCAVWVADLTRHESIAAMAAAVLREAPAQRFALAGLSMGGYVALEMMRQAPRRVERLALLDTRARPDSPEETQRRHQLVRIAEMAKGFAPVHKRMMPMLVHPSRSNDPELARVVQEMAEHVGLEAYRRQQAAIVGRPDFRPMLAGIACPTLVVCGREDALTPLAFHEEIARAVPNARLAIVENCGHLSTLEQPVAINDLLRDWLEA